MGPLSWGMAYTLEPSDTCSQVQGTKSSLTSFAPCSARSTSASSCRNVSMNWNSICTTSGAPEPDLIAVRSLVYSSSPCPALTYLILMSGCASSNSLTSLIMSGTHDQKVSSTGPPPVEPPQAAPPSKLAPASPAPLIFRKSRRVNSRLIEGPAPMLALSPTSLRHRTQNALYVSSLPQPGRGTVLARICHTNFAVSSNWRSAVGLFSAHCAPLPSHLRPGIPDSPRHGVAVGFYQFVHQVGYLVERENARSMAVEHGGVIDVVPPALQRRLDREVLDGGVRGAGGGALRRKVPDVAGTQTGVVNQDRHLDTAPCWEVRN